MKLTLVCGQDLFLDNFLVEWHPESLLSRTIIRPRVYIIDFETAVAFPDNSDPTERLVVGLPFPPELPYERPLPPELILVDPYCPFRLDIWQLGTGLHKFNVGIIFL